MLSVLLGLFGEPARLLLRYEKSALWSGDYWRFVTGHFVHANVTHLLLNVVGAGLIAALLARDYAPRQWIAILLGSIAAIDLGFVLFEPQLEWYVGLSGVLHGALAAGAVAWWQHETKALALTLSIVLVGKLGWEQLHGALPLSGDIDVIVDAHLYGACGGVAIASTLWIAQRWSRGARSL
jgi:rhomboid family GlyGly-CTERM serine protease